MKFEEVWPAFREGKKIRTKNWENGFYIDLQLLSSDANLLLFSALLTPIDMLDEGWEVIIDENHYFPRSNRSERRGKQ